MKLSVIIPNLNKADFIEETISSLSKNCMGDVEWVVVDDGSTDGSLEILESLEREYNQLKLFQNPGKGGSSARNYGARQAKGDYLIFLDSDDLLSSNCLSNRLGVIDSFPDFDLWVFPMTLFKNEASNVAYVNWVPGEESALKKFLSHRLPWQTMQPIWRADFVEKVGGFDEHFARLQDVEFHTRCLLAGARVKALPGEEPDCFYRIVGDKNTFKEEEFQRNYVSGAIMYYKKFENLVPPELKKYLAGTLLETLSWICQQHRIGAMNKTLYRELSNKLITTCSIKSQRQWLHFYFLVQSNSPFHVKGLKRSTQFFLGI